MTTKTTTVETAHGNLEYELVTCANCGNEVLTDEAAHITVNPAGIDHNWDGSTVAGGRQDALCPYCASSLFGVRSPKGFLGTTRDILIAKAFSCDDVVLVLVISGVSGGFLGFLLSLLVLAVF